MNKTEWISLAEKLPKDGVDVLCLWEYGYWSGDCPRMSVDRIQHHGNDVRDFQANYIHCYTHWMVLPKCPAVQRKKYEEILGAD